MRVRERMTTRWLWGALALASLAATPAYAQGVSVGGGVGVVTPQDVDASPWYTASVRLHPMSWLAVEPEFGFWRQTDSEPGCVPDLEVCFDAEATVQDVSIGANILLMAPGGRVRPWGGVGLGAHFLEAEVTFAESGRTSAVEQTELGVHFLGGLDVGITDRLSWFGAARYDVIPDVDLDQFKAYGGIRFTF